MGVKKLLIIFLYELYDSYKIVSDFADYELDIIVNLKEGRVVDIILSGYGLP